MEKNYNIDDIEDFLNQEMNAAELAAFEKEMAADKELAAEVDFHEDVIKGIQGAAPMDFQKMISETHGVLKEEGFFSEEAVEQTKASTIKKEAKVRRIGFSRVLAYAASVALVLFAGWWVFSSQPTQPEQLFANNFSIHQDVLSVEIEDRLAETGFGTNKEALNNLQIAIDNYNSGRYQEAVDQFSAFQANAPQDGLASYASFYKAIASLKLNNAEVAETALEALVKQKDRFPLAEDAKWYLALTYLKQEKIANAYPFLKELSVSGAYKEKATQLLAQYQ